MLKSIPTLNLPYDLVLRGWIKEGLITSAFIFPFVTTLSKFASTTQLQLESDRIGNMIWNAFRKLMFFESDRSNCLDGIENLPAEFYDKQATDFAAILKVVFSEEVQLLYEHQRRTATAALLRSTHTHRPSDLRAIADTVSASRS
jgi:hypothetical protein